ncbi:MAG: exodeoxyribonuclease VII large subunit [Clostridia bacterium]|nr:exodeoxyribonuclease VII large subunit [Clostridia bacterium]
MEEKRVISVSELNEYVKMLIDNDEILAHVCVRGEISNFTNHRTGHFYMTLKDEGSLIKAVMFRGYASKLKFLPENGMKVLVSGRVSAFVRDGQYQIYIENMEPDGVGALYIAYEQLKKKLTAEGLFDRSKKKPVPKIPTRIGIITSPTGAAVRDIINILGRRFPLCRPVLYPSLVQGDGAPANIIAGIDYFNEHKNVDVLIVGRGGGSLEDLWAFNDEALCRRVAASEIPIISAVGHETDFTLCDFAASVRAPTPSAAAELAVPESTELARKIGNVQTRMELLCTQKIKLSRERLARLASSRSLTSPMNLIDDKRMALGVAEEKLYSRMEKILERKKAMLGASAAKLDALNPLAVVARGYSAVFAGDGKLIKSVEQTKVGETVSFMLTDGKISAEVKTVEHDERKK